MSIATSSSALVERGLADARKRFAQHIIRERDGRTWLVGRPGGGSVDAYCVTATRAGEVIVSGDIDLVAFKGNYANPVHAVHWLGTSQDTEYYARQKAAIGMSGYDVVEYDEAVAAWDALSGLCDELDIAMVSADADLRAFAEGLASRVPPRWRDIARCLAVGVDLRAEIECMREAGHYEDVEGWGMTLRPRVITAHVAVQRLSELLIAEGTR